MRNRFVSFGAALAVALSVTTGVAYADDSNNDNGGASGTASGSSSTSSSSTGTGVDGAVGSVGNTVTGLLGSASASNTTSTSTTATSTAVPTPAHHPRFGGRFGGRFADPWYPGLPGDFPQLIDGTYLPANQFGLVNVGNIDVCGYQNWGDLEGFAQRSWVGRGWGHAVPHFGGNPAATWLALRSYAHCGPTVVVQHLPTLIDRSYLSLSDYGLDQRVGVCGYGTYNAFAQTWGSRLGGRLGGFRNRLGGNLRGWNAGWNRLRLQANCGPTVVVVPSSNTVTQEPASTPATLAPAPEVTSVDPGSTSTDTPTTQGTIPRGPAKDGGFDAAYAAAHGL